MGESDDADDECGESSCDVNEEETTFVDDNDSGEGGLGVLCEGEYEETF